MTKANLILRSGLLVGTLDITAASVQYYARTGKSPLNVLRFVASGVFGQAALSGGGLRIIVLLPDRFFFYRFFLPDLSQMGISRQKQDTYGGFVRNLYLGGDEPDRSSPEQYAAPVVRCR